MTWDAKIAANATLVGVCLVSMALWEVLVGKSHEQVVDPEHSSPPCP